MKHHRAVEKRGAMPRGAGRRAGGWRACPARNLADQSAPVPALRLEMASVMRGHVNSAASLLRATAQMCRAPLKRRPSARHSNLKAVAAARARIIRRARVMSTARARKSSVAVMKIARELGASISFNEASTSA